MRIPNKRLLPSHYISPLSDVTLLYRCAVSVYSKLPAAPKRRDLEQEEVDVSAPAHTINAMAAASMKHGCHQRFGRVLANMLNHQDDIP